MPPRPLIAANWKMNSIPKGALDPKSPYRTEGGADVWVFPTFLDIQACIEAKLVVGAQHASAEDEGAHTGDVSMRMLASLGCRAVLCGHSERRQDHGETNEDVAEQVAAALDAGLHPIVCIGETAAERKTKKHKKVVEAQMAVLPLGSDITIAYEPVWAIGTGQTASPAEAQEMHAYIRSLLPEDMRSKIRILYGGSIKPISAAALFREPDIDGGLVGGASLDPAMFAEIVKAAESAET
ncbi:MAG TPA: triose-phosphate isomerase [Candidatus Peribacteraceae bacterium]|nr:triose-phosphate isomerase [Candidatus Peribacteraceae bacterium]